MEEKYYRTLVRAISPSKEGVWLCVPAWDSDVAVLRVFTSEIENQIARHGRFLADVNLGTEFAETLHFKNFEFG